MDSFALLALLGVGLLAGLLSSGSGDDGSDAATDGDDTLRGTPDRDTLAGMGGNDLMLGNAAGDILDGGPGNDNLWGESGDDAANGGAGDDRLSDAYGRDTLLGGAGNDRLDARDLPGEEGADYLFGGDGGDTLTGDTGDSLTGGAGADLFVNGFQPDADGSRAVPTPPYGAPFLTVADYAPGEDLLEVNINGGDETAVTLDSYFDPFTGIYGTALRVDGLLYAVLQGVAPGDVDPADIAVVENPPVTAITGTPGDDVIDGTPGPDAIDAGAGADRITAQNGDDTVLAGDGADTVEGGRGEDDLFGGTGDDVLSNIDDFLATNPQPPFPFIRDVPQDHLFGGDGNDTMSGSGSNMTLQGGAGDDVVSVGQTVVSALYGDGGNDRLEIGTLSGPSLTRTVPIADGGDGDDTIWSLGGGHLTVAGGAGNDLLVTEPFRTFPLVDSAADPDGRTAQSIFVVPDFRQSELFGGDGDDTILSDFSFDRVFGGSGDDWLQHGVGYPNPGLPVGILSQSLSGGDGNDTLDGFSDAVPHFPTGMDGGAGDDLLRADQGDIVTTGDGADVIVKGGLVDAAGNPLVPPRDIDAIRVTDFDPTRDRLDIDTFGANLAADDLSLHETADGTEVRLAGTLHALLLGVTPGDIPPDAIAVIDFAALPPA